VALPPLVGRKPIPDIFPIGGRKEDEGDIPSEKRLCIRSLPGKSVNLEGKIKGREGK